MVLVPDRSAPWVRATDAAEVEDVPAWQELLGFAVFGAAAHQDHRHPQYGLLGPGTPPDRR